MTQQQAQDDSCGALDRQRTFILGNCLRGCFEAEFDSQDIAFDVLSARFLKSYPAPGGRHILMWVREPNKYGILDTVLCYQGLTSTATVSEEAISACRTSFHSG